MSRQLSELLQVYGVTALPMGVALMQRRARLTTYLRWPLVALLAAIAGSFAWWLIRAPIVAMSPRASPTLIWFVGVAFFAILGYCVGLALTVNRPAAVEAAIPRRRRDGLTLASVGIPLEDETGDEGPTSKAIG